MSIELRKVAIIGTGHVGSHVAFSLTNYTWWTSTKIKPSLKLPILMML